MVFGDELIADWRNKWSEDNHRCKAYGVDGKLYPATDWIKGKEVRVFKMPGISDLVVPYVIAGIEDQIKDIGLDFTVNYYGVDPSTVSQVRQATRSDGILDGARLASILVSEDWRNPLKGGVPHGDFIISDQYLQLGQENWGQSEFIKGYGIVSLPGSRQKSLNFIRNISKHESGHLFGFQQHHRIAEGIEGGYTPVSACNMEWSASTLKTCQKCNDAMKFYWKGIQNRDGLNYFK